MLPLYLSQSFAWHALLAAAIVSIVSGVIGTFVILRGMAFAVHGTAELAFTGAAGGLLVADDPIAGAFVGALIVASILGFLGNKEKDRNTNIGVILAFGLGVGVLLLSLYQGFATQATNILFGNIFGINTNQLIWLVIISTVMLLSITYIFRPLLFSSVDPEVAEAKGVPVKFLNIIFLYILALTVTAAAQIVGTLLVLSLAITPAAAAVKIANKPSSVVMFSVIFALASSVGGILISLASGNIKPSVCVTFLSFALYVFARIYGK